MTAWNMPWWHAWLTGIGMALAGFTVVIIIDSIVDKYKKKKALRLGEQHERAHIKIYHPYCTTKEGRYVHRKRA